MVIIVYGESQVTTFPIKEPTLALIISTTKDELKDNATGKLLNPQGGIQDLSTPDTQHYIKLPVLAVCSAQSHKTSSQEGAHSGRLNVDIHIAECPIDITAHNKGVTLAASDLVDCTTNGILNVFAVPQLSSMGIDEHIGKFGLSSSPITLLFLDSHPFNCKPLCY